MERLQSVLVHAWVKPVFLFLCQIPAQSQIDFPGRYCSAQTVSKPWALFIEILIFHNRDNKVSRNHSNYDALRVKHWERVMIIAC